MTKMCRQLFSHQRGPAFGWREHLLDVSGKWETVESITAVNER